MTIHDVLKRPLVTEKGITKKEEERTLCFEVAKDANKIMVKQAVEKLFKVKVEDSAHGHFRRQTAPPREDSRAIGRTGRKAYVKLEAGQKVPEFTEM